MAKPPDTAPANDTLPAPPSDPSASGAAERQRKLDRERKKGAADMLVLALLEERQRHGYEIAKLITERSGGVLVFHAASLYTLLYRLEKAGLIHGRWVEKAGQRRRRFYRLSDAGRSALGIERHDWRAFVEAVDRVVRPRPA